MIGHAPHRVYQLPISLQRVFGREFSERDLLTSRSSLRGRPSEIRGSCARREASDQRNEVRLLRPFQPTRPRILGSSTQRNGSRCIGSRASLEPPRRNTDIGGDWRIAQNCLLRRDTSAKPTTEHPVHLFAIVGCERDEAREQRFAASRYVSAEMRAFDGRKADGKPRREGKSASVALFSLESERSAEARKALRTRGEDGSSWKAETYRRNDGKTFSLCVERKRKRNRVYHDAFTTRLPTRHSLDPYE